jgi:heme exporter protein A
MAILGTGAGNWVESNVQSKLSSSLPYTVDRYVSKLISIRQTPHLSSVSDAVQTAASESPAPVATVLEAVDLECIRSDRTLFSGLSFALESSQVLQVDGPNGSGKTSLLRMLCGLTLPSQGEVRWCGQDIQRVRSEFLSQVLYVGHAHGVKDELTALENLKMARALGRARQDASLEQALEYVGLYGFEDLPVRKLSAGQRRRVALARLLVCEARLWVLDEPFTALDKTGIKAMEALVEAHSAAEGMVIVTTHQPINLPCCSMTRIHLVA